MLTNERKEMYNLEQYNQKLQREMNSLKHENITFSNNNNTLPVQMKKDDDIASSSSEVRKLKNFIDELKKDNQQLKKDLEEKNRLQESSLRDD